MPGTAGLISGFGTRQYIAYRFDRFPDLAAKAEPPGNRNPVITRTDGIHPFIGFTLRSYGAVDQRSRIDPPTAVIAQGYPVGKVGGEADFIDIALMAAFPAKVDRQVDRERAGGKPVALIDKGIGITTAGADIDKPEPFYITLRKPGRNLDRYDKAIAVDYPVVYIATQQEGARRAGLPFVLDKARPVREAAVVEGIIGRGADKPHAHIGPDIKTIIPGDIIFRRKIIPLIKLAVKIDYPFTTVQVCLHVEITGLAPLAAITVKAGKAVGQVKRKGAVGGAHTQVERGIGPVPERRNRTGAGHLETGVFLREINAAGYFLVVCFDIGRIPPGFYREGFLFFLCACIIYEKYAGRSAYPSCFFQIIKFSETISCSK